MYLVLEIDFIIAFTINFVGDEYVGLCIEHTVRKAFLDSFFQPMKALFMMILVECPVTYFHRQVKESWIK